MPRLVARTIALIRRFARARRGATAVEFAFIAMPLMLFTFGLLELGLILLVTTTLDTATDFATRNIRTGEFQNGEDVTKESFKQLVCVNMTWLEAGCTEKLVVEAETFDTFAVAGGAQPANPKDLDPEKTCWSVGNPEDIVLVRTYYEWPIVSPLLLPIFQSAGRQGRVLSSARIFRNEPYNAALTPVGAKCGS